MRGKFRLDVTVRVSQLSPEGYPTGQGLEIREDLVINADSFLGVAAVLGKFDELARALNGAAAAIP
jgi:hypothetical protein